MIQRVILIVLDSVGIGGAPDAGAYGDAGSNTLGNTAAYVGGLRIPHLEALGIGNLTQIQGVRQNARPLGAFGRMQEQSAGKDSTTGHWEIAGLISDKPFPTYPHGFPADVITSFEQAIGTKVLGNQVASGTAIIEALGEEHMLTGRPIVYTSADSVFQIAAHEDVIPPEKLYDMCRIARKILDGKHRVARVIARPFIGEKGAFVRTAGRLDFSLAPPELTLLDHLMQKGIHVHAIGKVADLFAGRGVVSQTPTDNNMHGVDETIKAIKKYPAPAFIWTNCVDFDSLYGHRNDPVGYARALEAFDARLPEIQSALKPGDILMITADHGCDPTTESTDHSRELVPLLVYGHSVRAGVNLGLRNTFADIAATVAHVFDLPPIGPGTSFAKDIFV